MKSRTTTKQNMAFNRYLKTTFDPAQQWANSQNGIDWIKTHVPSLYDLMPREAEILAAVYVIYINDKAAYVGQSLRTVRRLFVHAHSLATNPEIMYGMKPEEVDQAEIEMKLMTAPILNEKLRVSAEASTVTALDPVLQPYHRIPGMAADYCIPRAARRQAMIHAGVIKI